MADPVPSPLPAWLQRLSPTARLAAFVAAVLLAIFAAAVLVGIVSQTVEQGAPPSVPGLLATLVAALIGIAAAWFAWRIYGYWRLVGQSAYQRRYAKAWVAIFGAGMIVGVLFGIANDATGGVALLFSNDPLRPAAALGIAAATAVTLIASLIVYHRAIDDHEERAYLWANSAAFYFLSIAIPVAWLLARGGLIPAIGIGAMMLILLMSFAINLAVWAWLKFR